MLRDFRLLVSTIPDPVILLFQFQRIRNLTFRDSTISGCAIPRFQIARFRVSELRANSLSERQNFLINWGMGCILYLEIERILHFAKLVGRVLVQRESPTNLSPTHREDYQITWLQPEPSEEAKTSL